MRKQSDLPTITTIVKSDSDTPDSKSDPLSTMFCFLVTSHTRLAQQNSVGSRVKWQEHGLWSQKGRFKSQEYHFPAL